MIIIPMFGQYVAFCHNGSSYCVKATRLECIQHCIMNVTTTKSYSALQLQNIFGDTI